MDRSTRIFYIIILIFQVSLQRRSVQPPSFPFLSPAVGYSFDSLLSLLSPGKRYDLLGDFLVSIVGFILQSEIKAMQVHQGISYVT